jgi:hypothetical protein
MCVIYTNEIQTLIRQTHIKYNLDVCSVQRDRIDAERYKSRLHGVDVRFCVWKSWTSIAYQSV